MLEFLVPFLYPEKPMRVTITVGNTIFGALSGERPVDWGQVVKDIVQRLFSRMGKSKTTPICPYVFHNSIMSMRSCFRPRRRSTG